MTHCVTNPHLTAFRFFRQICSTLFFLMFCVFHTAYNRIPKNLVRLLLLLAVSPCARHKMVDYHYLHQPSNWKLVVFSISSQPVVLTTWPEEADKTRAPEAVGLSPAHLHIGNAPGIELLKRPSRQTDHLAGCCLCPWTSKYSRPGAACQMVQTLFRQ